MHVDGFWHDVFIVSRIATPSSSQTLHIQIAIKI